MLGKDELEFFGKTKTLGLFGDKKFPFKSGPKSSMARKEALSHIKKLLVQIKPNKIYITPNRGLEELVIPLLSFLDVPYVIVNPYKGYFDGCSVESKVKLLVALENSKSVVTIAKRPKNILEHEKSYKESLDFIYENSDVVICVTGPEPSDTLKRIQKNFKSDDKIIVLNFVDYPGD